MEEKIPGKKTPKSPDKPDSPQGEGKQPSPRMNSSLLWLLLVVSVVGLVFMFRESGGDRSEIEYSFFRQQLDAENIAKVEIQGQKLSGEFKKAPRDPNAEVTKADQVADGKPAEPVRLEKKFTLFLPPLVGEKLDELLIAKGVEVAAKPPTDSAGFLMLVWIGIIVAFMVFMWIMMRRTREQFMGGGLFSGFSKSPAKLYDASKQEVTFDDVAGLEGVKADLTEIVEFLKNPEKFQRLGGRVPKGVLLMGPPGTGKTLLARAVAGEAEVPFFSISGSEFIQLFVGVGASRVRDLFTTAKENAPAILFIDEIDAVGRQRGAGMGGGHDEREQTLNQILSEMDGFTQNTSVIVLAATNRPDVLDPALLRPGRFDRHITVDRPSLKGRRQIFDVHIKGIPLADDVDLDRLASATVGLTGADIRNLVNEATLWATRQGKDFVTMDDFETARDKILMGPKREEVLAGKEKTMTAYHEMGHALLAWIVPGIDPLHKVTIIPRGRALGVTLLLPEEDRLNIGESRLLAQLVFILGGRAAEKLVFDEYSAGAENDLKQATKIARKMVTHWGMSERIGPVAYSTSEEHPFLGREMAQEHREFSEHTAQIIDQEVARILHSAGDRATQLLTEHREELNKLASALEEREVLDMDEIEAIVGPSVNVRADNNGQPEDVKLASEAKGNGQPAGPPKDEAKSSN